MSEIYTLVVQSFGKRRVYALCNHEKTDLCTVPHAYITGRAKPNFPVPAIPYVFQWDYSLGIELYTMPPLSEDEWEREEELWQDYCDSLDELEAFNRNST